MDEARGNYQLNMDIADQNRKSTVEGDREMK